MDQILSPYMQSCYHVINNSTQVIHRIQQKQISPFAILATLDVKSLYLKIPQAQGINTVLIRLYNSGFSPRFKRSSLKRLLEFILKDNFFTYTDRIYKQKSGVAMGTRCAPNFANLFMASLEEEFLQTESKQGRPQPSMWLRYIDNIILIWEHDEQTLKFFVQILNGFDNNINFTLDFSYNSIDFLDINIYKGKKFSNQGLLDFQPYRKTCHKKLLLEI